MRSTRAAAAVARLNRRSEGHDYALVLTNTGLFKLRERTEGGDRELCDALALDEFVRFVDAMGPQKLVRITKNEAEFVKQLVKKPKA